jgi:hypothetical protein
MKVNFILLVFILFAQITYAQKVLVENLNETPTESTESSESTQDVDTNTVSIVLAKKNQNVNLDIFKNLQAFDSFEKVIQSFPQLSCKNEFVSPLVLKCYICTFQAKTSRWELEFHRKEVGDESCELAGISKVESNSSKFEVNREEFDQMLKKNFSVSLTKAGDKWLAGTAEEDFQVFKEKVFSNSKNTFVEKLRMQMRYLHSLINQEKITNAMDQMRVGFASMEAKALEDFRDELFSEDSTAKRTGNIARLRQILFPEKNKDEEISQEETEKAKVPEEINLSLVSSLVFHHSLKSKEDYKNCYANLVQKVLPIEVSEENAKNLIPSELLNLATMEVKEVGASVEPPVEKSETDKSEPKQAEADQEPTKNTRVLISYNKDYAAKKEKAGVPYCKVFQRLLKADENPPKLEANICRDITGYFLNVEKRYKEFFKGDESESFKMYRALLVRNLMLASEAEYFKALEELKKINESPKPSPELLKEQSQKIEFSLSKVSDYQEELVGLLPYLEESFKLRRDWLLKGISSKDVFPICD